jgi:hypothetical protein
LRCSECPLPGYGLQDFFLGHVRPVRRGVDVVEAGEQRRRLAVVNADRDQPDVGVAHALDQRAVPLKLDPRPIETRARHEKEEVGASAESIVDIADETVARLIGPSVVEDVVFAYLVGERERVPLDERLVGVRMADEHFWLGHGADRSRSGRSSGG